MLQMLSVIYEPVARTPLIQCLTKAGIRDPNGKAFILKTLDPFLERLEKTGLLVRTDAQLRCHEDILEVLTRRAVQEGRFRVMAAAVQSARKVEKSWGSVYFKSYEQAVREVRIALYLHKLADVGTQLALCASEFPLEFRERHPYQLICNRPFDRDWFRALPKAIRGDVLTEILSEAALRLEPAAEPYAALKELWDSEKETCPDECRYLLAEQRVLRGKPEEAGQLLEGRESVEALALRGWIAFLSGANEDAIEHYETALQVLKKDTGKRKVYFDTLSGIFFILALIKTGDPTRRRQAAGFITIVRKDKYHRFLAVYLILNGMIQFLQGAVGNIGEVLGPWLAPQSNSLAVLVRAMAHYWLDIDAAKRLVEPLETFFVAAKACGYAWLAGELAELLSRLGCKNASYAEQALRLREESGTLSILDVIQRQEPWERSLDALLHLRSAEDSQAGTAAKASRLVWLLEYDRGHCEFEPREQKRTASGVWTKGRPIALKRLVSKADTLDFLTPQDLKICSSIQTETEYQYYGRYGQTVYSFDEDRALSAMVGHPLLFWKDSPTVRVELVKGEPELRVSRKGKQLSIGISPKIEGARGVVVAKDAPNRLRVISVTEEYRRMAAILGGGLRVPAQAKERVLETITTLSPLVTVHSDIGGGTENVEEVAADPRPHLHLLPAGAGLTVQLLVQPFGGEGPYFAPGSGGKTVIAEIGGKRVQAQRDLGQEKTQSQRAINACPTLAGREEVEGEWILEDPEDCLETLLELQALGDEALVEWPEGEKLRVTHPISLQQMGLNIRREHDWFNTTGELRVDDSQVLELQKLLELVQATPSRFLPLGEGQFLALTQEFRKRLDELNAYSEPSGKGVRFHGLAALALEDFTESVGVLRTDKHWKAHAKRLQEIQDRHAEIPSTLQAELRDYQIDGFRWLTRLADWGVGACLADDMGLGKTVQALALILTRAQRGPTLIVAPTSVCMNWLDEARRFAPTLNVILFGGKERQQTLAGLQAFDVLVCSYGLLQQEAAILNQVSWETIVLDEAQAIKNPATKRSKAAMALQGEFKMITTGTPIENHLGELWNLFRFLNPGLLGSLEHFNQRFAIPIEKQGDRSARNQLKKLIQPFILRRDKNQVLEELPPRTEIVLHVELNPEETALYEALRRKAVENLTAAEAPPGQKHLQILAEIMRLRRVCCHPRLILPESSTASSKLAVFGEVMEELLDNRHKALVFSQFVDHLTLIREFLDKKGIAYQYLDGSTPAAERKKRIDAFQSGDGDVFLISLKAGGFGINLTAADYVIHMDPWWNPAVEDQASDRAHRIGQQRPVTVYRLVTKGTIEEKIVDLHHHKRDLAHSLLEGADMSGKMSAEEMLRLIQEV